jgi:hypothetical protein
VSTETLTRKESTVPPPAPAAAPEDALHKRARKRVERTHRVKANIAAFLVAMIVLIPIWLIVEWQGAGSFERWSDGDGPGDWAPWILWIAVPWFLWVAFVCLSAYIDRDKEGEIEREVRRLREGGPGT